MTATTKTKSKYMILIFFMVIFLLFHATRQVLPPSLPLIKDEFQINYTITGLLASSFDIGYSVVLLLFSYVAALIGSRKLIFSGLLWLSFTLFLSALVVSAEQLAFLRILSGTAYGTFFAISIALTSTLFPRKRGLALGVLIGLGAGTGKFLTPLLATFFLPSMGWRFLFYLLAIPALIVAILFIFFVKDIENIQGLVKISREELINKVIANRSLVTVSALNSLIIGTMVAFYSFLPLYLVNELGMEISFGAFSLTILNIMGIPAGFILGYLSDRFGRRSIAISVVGLSAPVIYVFTFIVSALPIIVMILLLGILLGTAFPVTLSIVGDISPKKYLHIGIGYVNSLTIVGTLFMSLLSGFISDRFGIVNVFSFIALVTIITALMMSKLPKRY